MKSIHYALGGLALFLLLPKKAKGSTTTTSSGSTAYSGLSYLGQHNLPRGMRNNNPGNLRISSNAWQGKIPASMNTDGAFEQFYNYAYGIRAMIKLLIHYMTVKKLVTIRDIISTYAPSSENDTNAYIRNVATATGFPPDWPLSPSPDTLRRLVIAMSRVENGREAITTDQFNRAWSLV